MKQLIFLLILLFSIQISAQESLTLLLDVNSSFNEDEKKSEHQEFLEEFINQISTKILKKENVTVYKTQEVDTISSLEGKINYINAIKPHLVISLNVHTSDDAELRGSNIIVEKNESEADTEYFSQFYTSQLLRYGIPENGITSTSDNEFLNDIEKPAIIFYLGYLTNDEDNAVLTNDGETYPMAEYLANVIYHTYFTKN